MVFENGNTEQSLPKTKTLIQAKIKKKKQSNKRKCSG